MCLNAATVNNACVCVCVEHKTCCKQLDSSDLSLTLLPFSLPCHPHYLAVTCCHSVLHQARRRRGDGAAPSASETKKVEPSPECRLARPLIWAQWPSCAPSSTWLNLVQCLEIHPVVLVQVSLLLMEFLIDHCKYLADFHSAPGSACMFYMLQQFRHVKAECVFSHALFKGRNRGKNGDVEPESVCASVVYISECIQQAGQGVPRGNKADSLCWSHPPSICCYVRSVRVMTSDRKTTSLMREVPWLCLQWELAALVGCFDFH